MGSQPTAPGVEGASFHLALGLQVPQLWPPFSLHLACRSPALQHFLGCKAISESGLWKVFEDKMCLLFQLLPPTPHTHLIWSRSLSLLAILRMMGLGPGLSRLSPTEGLPSLPPRISFMLQLRPTEPAQSLSSEGHSVSSAGSAGSRYLGSQKHVL